MVDIAVQNRNCFSLPGSEFPSDEGYGPLSFYSARYVSSPGIQPGTFRYLRSGELLAPSGASGVGRAAASAGGASGALVTHTKSVHTKVHHLDKKTGEIQSFTAPTGCSELGHQKWLSDQQKLLDRDERFVLQRVSRDVLIDHQPPAVGKFARRVRHSAKNPFTFPVYPSHQQLLIASGRDLAIQEIHVPSPSKKRVWRVTQCNWRAFDDVKVMYSPEHHSAHFKNVALCGSVWTCPVCSAKVSQRRTVELKAASETHVGAGGAMLMVTLTFSHSRHDDLKKLIGDSKRSHGLTSALQRFRNSRSYKRIKEELGMIGLVRNLEVTHSEKNGWHPHVHELWFIETTISARHLARIKIELFDTWLRACKNAKLSPPNRTYGLDIRPAWTAEEYMTKFGSQRKWSPEAELTRSHSKKSRDSRSVTPFDLLRMVSHGVQRAARARQLFREYATAFFGRAQLFWTVGLKALFAIEEKTDEQLAAEQAADAVEVTTISKNRWKKLLRLKYEARSLVLRLAESGGSAAVERYLFDTFGPDLSRAFFKPMNWFRPPYFALAV